MTSKMRNAAASLAALALVGVGLVTSAAPATATGAVPFTATWSGSATIRLPATFVFDGTGTSDPLGPIHAHGDATINGVGIGCLGNLVNTNLVTITAADGTLDLTSKDVGCITGVGTFHGMGTWTVTGGTGRYAHAVGSGSLDGRVNIVAGTSTLVANGYLVF